MNQDRLLLHPWETSHTDRLQRELRRLQPRWLPAFSIIYTFLQQAKRKKKKKRVEILHVIDKSIME